MTILIVTYNSADVIKDCLESASAELQVGDKIVVVDNASNDETREIVGSYGEQVKLIALKQNSGFAKGVNVAAQCVPEGSSVLLLNPDAVLGQSCLSTLRRSLTMTGAAVLAPVLAHPSGSTKTVAAGGFPTLYNVSAHFLGIAGALNRAGLPFRGFHFYENRLREQKSLVKADWVSGGCCLISPEAWSKFSPLTEQWFMYAEDIELCLRVRRAGYVVGVEPSATATHAIGSSANKVGGRISSLWVINLFELYSQEFSASSIDRLLWKLTVSAGLFIRASVFWCRSIGQAGESPQRAKRFTRNALELLRA